MLGKLSGSDLFTFDRTLRAPSVPLPDQLPGPYAEAWKEFDKLQKAVSGQGPFRWAHWAFDTLAFGSSVLGFHLLKGHRPAMAAGVGAIVVASAEIFSYFNRRERFLHWQCPRCHSEWPGTKTQKDTTCKICRLRLHQMTP